MKRSTTVLLAVVAFAGAWAIGYTTRLSPGFWVGINADTGKVIGVVNTTKWIGTKFQVSARQFPGSNGWSIVVNAYAGPEGSVQHDQRP